MPERFFVRLERELRRAGVAGPYARRAALELREHFEDLEADALAAGQTPRAAAREARARLGRVDDIVAQAKVHRELRSMLAWIAPATTMLHDWSHRHAPSSDARHSLVRWGVAAGGGATATVALLAAMQVSITLA